ncbi:MAG: class I SAM-dependent DNA methyltransferase [Desulfovibrio sp.]
MSDTAIREFIHRWRKSGGSEQANSQLFLTQLCGLLGVPEPEPAEPYSEGDYVFERRVVFHHGDGSTSRGRIDLYKRGCFVLESKQGTLRKEDEALSEAERTRRANMRKGAALRGSRGWDEAMLRAKGQGERYIRNLPTEEGRPPFLLVVDVGHTIELYSEFSCTGGAYIPFPDAGSHRIHLDELLEEETREHLRLVWTDPFALDPSRRAAKVTRDIARSLGDLARLLEAAGHAPETVAGFLMRCLFTMFAEDVGLLPQSSFTKLLYSFRDKPDQLAATLEELWSKMDTGGDSIALREHVKRFNGGLFHDSKALPLNRDQLELLIESARADWCDVEPAIFGTLLERALNPRERHKLGAHYTPRAYVERLVLPTVIDPLREEWNEVRTAAVALMRRDDKDAATKGVKDFHNKLCRIRILDPACGSGNFLYVTLEHLKRLEGEVLDLEQQLGMTWIRLESGGLKVDPHQFLGIEINPRAAAIAELVLWIGYLQWHFRTLKGVAPAEPIIQDFKNIQCRDALIEYDERKPLLGADGEPVTIWDGRTTKPHPATGEEVPDETARTAVYEYVNPRQARWPQADYIVGNPPFIGAKLKRTLLGDGYFNALNVAYPALPESIDFVMYWWHRAAELVRTGKALRFGFISTNSIRQTFNRRVIQSHMEAKRPLSLAFAVSDHPWVDEAGSAAVRIAMTVGQTGMQEGRLVTVTHEYKTGMERDVELLETTGKIHADLSIGVDVSVAIPLKATSGLSCPGVKLHGAGFIVTPEQAIALGLGTVPGLNKYITEYRNGKDLTSRPRGILLIDLYGLNESDVRTHFPAVYQWLYERVKQERQAKTGNSKDSKEYADKWWLHGKPRPSLREALVGLTRYIATPVTSKHRFFSFLDSSILADDALIVFSFADAFSLGVLSCNFHVCWALSQGASLGPTPRYIKTRCFETFPFPVATEAQKSAIRALGEELDAHRKARLAEHPKLTMTQMYNVLEALRAGRELTPAERQINDQGLVTLLKDIHDRLDAAVAEAYGWPANLPEHEILERLVALNAERAAEEERGVIRWLRPEYQARLHKPVRVQQAKLVAGAEQAKGEKLPWPKTLAERTRAVLDALARVAGPADVEHIRSQYARAQARQVEEILETLASLGQVTRLEDGRYLRH